jgi:hypothetical protein
MKPLLKSQSMADKALARIKRWGRGSVFVPRDFLDLGSRGAVDMALKRLVGAGRIRRLCRGVYDLPRKHARLGVLTPPLHLVAQAIARSGGLLLQPSGASAANALGLSTQVPAQLEYYTDGSSRVTSVGKQAIRFRQATPKRLLGAGTTAGLVIQALRFMGRDGLRENQLAALARRLNDSDKRKLGQLAVDAPAWMRPLLRRISETSAHRTAS